MTNRIRIICIILAVVLLITGCSTLEKQMQAPAEFYYRTAQTDYYSENGVIASETRETVLINTSIVELLNVYMEGPVSDKLLSPYPAGTQVLDVQQNENEVIITVNHPFEKLSGVELTLACACMAMTVISYTNAELVTIQIEDMSIGGKDAITLTKDALIFADIAATPN